jgi:hypothetical protein
MTWQIYALGDHHHAVSEPLPELKALTQTSTGKAFRRIGRFIQLALIGASRCASGQALPTDTAVYFASARGDLELTLEIMRQLYRESQTPKPLNFVNTVSNAACFYLAQHLGLQSRSNFICNRYFAFESVLQLATLDLALGVVDSALVGSLDIATTPLSEHRQRLLLPEHTPMGEGSHWLWLGAMNSARPRIGELLAAQHFTDRSVLMSWIKQQALSNDCALSAGQFLSPQDFAEIKTTVGLKQVFDYRDERAYYDSHSGAVLGAFLGSSSPASLLLHINADHEQRYSVLLARR